MVQLACWLYQLAMVLGCAGTVKAAVFDGNTESKVRDMIEETMHCRNVPGLTIAVVKGNATWVQGFGQADTGREVNSQSLFGIGSLTKAFTMTMLAGLLEENGFTWTSKVRDVLGDDFKFIDDVRTKETTIRDLLSHRTGLARLDIGLMAGFPRDKFTREGLSRLLQHLPAAHEFRDQFLYNNYMYTLLGHICEKLGGDIWENLVRRRLLTPVGMTSSFILNNPDDLQRENIAKPYIYDDGEFKNGTQSLYDIFPNEPAGAIFSSSEEMVKWIKFNLNKGKTEHGDQLIKEDMLEDAMKRTTPQTSRIGDICRPDYPVSNSLGSYGYAWFITDYRGYRVYFHSGGLYSYVSYLWIYPDLDIGVFISVNGPAFKSGDTLRSIMYYVSDLLLDETPWINQTTACTFPEPWKKSPADNSTAEETQPLVHGTDYEGVYNNIMLPDIRMAVQNDSSESTLRAHVGNVLGSMHPTLDADRFLFEITAPWEIARAYRDDNNITTMINVTFNRNGGIVDEAVFEFEVNVTFSRKESKTSSGANSVHLHMVAVFILVQTFSELNRFI